MIATPPALLICLAPSQCRPQKWWPRTPGTRPTAPAPTLRPCCMPLKRSPSSLPLSSHSPARPPPYPSSIPSSSATLMNKTPSSMTSTGAWWCRRWTQMHSRCQPPLTFGHCTLPSSGWTMKAPVGERGGHSPLWTPSLLQCGHVSLQRLSSSRSGSEALLNQVCPGAHLERLLHVCRGNDC